MGVDDVGLFKDKMRDAVKGSARVVDIEGGSGNMADPRGGQAMWMSGSMKLIVTADGVPETEVDWQGKIRCKYRPHEDQTIPVTVDRANPQNISIEWTELPTYEDWARQYKQMTQEVKQQQNTLEEQHASGAITDDEADDESIRLLQRLVDEE